MSRYGEQQGGGDDGPYRAGGHRYTSSAPRQHPFPEGLYQHAAGYSATRHTGPPQASYRPQDWQSHAHLSHGPTSRDSGSSGSHALPPPISGGSGAQTHGDHGGAGYSRAAPLETPTVNLPLTWQQQEQLQQQQSQIESLEAPSSQSQPWQQEQLTASPSDVLPGQPLTWQQERQLKEPAGGDTELLPVVTRSDIGGRRYPLRPGAPVGCGSPAFLHSEAVCIPTLAPIHSSFYLAPL